MNDARQPRFAEALVARRSKRHGASAVMRQDSTTLAAMIHGETAKIFERGKRAFTLIELVVVVSVIVVLVTLVLPSTISLWGQRRVADAENTLSGVLMTARMRSMQASRPAAATALPGTSTRYGGGQSGLLFWVDTLGIQRISPIEQADPGDVVWQNVFRITGDRDYDLPVPMRAVPRYAADTPTVGDPMTFDNNELPHNNFLNASGNAGQRHRNFFTMVYSAEGDLIVWRDVLIQDPDIDEDGRGDRTHLPVGNGEKGASKDRAVGRYYIQLGNPPPSPLIDSDNRQPVPDLITLGGSNPVAINWPSVDGVLVYDNSEFEALRVDVGTDGREMRAYLLRRSHPFYVNRFTGAVIKGPAGDAP